MAWTDFEHTIWKTLSVSELEQRSSYNLAISGGLDSMVLLRIMKRLKPQAKLTVAYYHHGPSKDLTQRKYRDECLELVRSESTSQPNISFITETCAEELLSESAFRSARWDFFKRVFQDGQPILTAHHLDDWVETLTLKLIRGVGPEGFIAFKQWDGHIFRPFLEIPKTELLAYAAAADVKWKDDPSNDSDQYLRNWLRQSWFKSLDEKNPRGYENYSRSLLRLCQSVSENQPSVLQFFRDSAHLGLDRFWFNSLGEKSQIKTLAQFLRHHSILNVTSGHLAEIQKRLDKNQKDITFSIAHVKWLINETQIMIVL